MAYISLECHRELELYLLEWTILLLDLAALEFEINDFKTKEDMSWLLEIKADLDVSIISLEKNIVDWHQEIPQLEISL